MKAASFDYVSAQSLADVLDHLKKLGDDALIIAGGQTLIPLLVMRLARPGVLIDINHVAALTGVEETERGIRINTCTRQNFVLNSPLAKSRVPLLAKALPFVGHHQTRNRGTVGGSVVHGDPAAEIPLVSVALDAQITLRSTKKTRQVSAADFYLGPMMNARETDECLVDVEFPVWDEDGSLGCSFQEVSERHGDFAVVSAAAQVLLDRDGVCRRVALAVGGVSGVPVRLNAAESVLISNIPTEPLIEEALPALDAAIDPEDDQAASADYRRRVAKVLVARAVRDAVANAGEGSK